MKKKMNSKKMKTKTVAKKSSVTKKSRYSKPKLDNFENLVISGIVGGTGGGL